MAFVPGNPTKSLQPIQQRQFCIFASVMLTLMVALTVALSLLRTDGTLIYVLDDPYIHLAVAESILSGGYGINIDEFASPSSSILYPFILSLTLLIGLGDWGPLVVNMIAAFFTAWLIASLIWKHAVDPSRWSSIIGATICLLPFFVAFNLPALPLTGMEHTLHILASLCVIVGVSGLRSQEPPSTLLIAGILFAPLFRFEGVALAGAALLALLFVGQIRWFGILASVLAVILAVYVGTMITLGLPPLPSSVLLKSSFSQTALDESGASVIKTAFANIRYSLLGYFGVIFGGTIALLFLAFFRMPGASRRLHLPMIFVVTTSLMAHVVFGNYGWFGRYEAYAVAICLAALTIFYGHVLRKRTNILWQRFLAVIILLAAVATPYFSIWTSSSAASENVYAQQYQMHRFATDFFPHPVAVNDLGWVSYKNDMHVLDLWGLGSEKVRKMRVGGGLSKGNVAQLADEAGSIFAMVYDEWFAGKIPADWCRIAVLTTPIVTADNADVAFYLIRSDYGAKMQSALAEFAAALPKISQLKRFECPG